MSIFHHQLSNLIKAKIMQLSKAFKQYTPKIADQITKITCQMILQLFLFQRR